MNSIFKRVKVGAAVLSMLAAAAAVHAAPVGAPITVQESGVTGAVANLLTVDQLSGQYDEAFTVTSVTGPNTGKFVTEAIFNAGGWFNSGSPVISQVNGFGVGGYGLYAKFSAAGDYDTTVGVSFTGTAAYLEIWADPNQNTNYDVTNPAIGNVSNLTLVSPAASITDDQLLGTATLLITGEGSANPGVANGNFELIFGNWQLNGPAGLNGDAYFAGPRPFYVMMDLNGNFQSFIPVSGSTTLLLNNSANAFWYATPEPGALALVGVALLGMGFVGRRARKV